MKYRKIANTDLEVSSICLGTWAFGGDCWGEADDAQSIRVIEEAVDKGINFIDTAPIYGSGRSEEVVGKAIKNKAGVIIATKCGLEQKGKSIRPNLHADFIRKEAEGSLRRLGVETIDLYQCHWPDPNTSMKETFGEMDKLVREGKIKYIGVSNFEKGVLERSMRAAPIVSDQVEYSLFKRKIEEELMPFCGENKVSVLTYGPLGGGILTGKYKTPPTFPKGDVRNFFYTFYKEPFWSKAKALVSVLEELAAKRQCPVSDIAINWVLSHAAVTSCIVGCRTPEQLRQNITAADWELSADELAKIQGEYQKVFG
ncbi:MAG: aldo/keto reductase [Candidatus Omnitrophota bacterium]